MEGLKFMRWLAAALALLSTLAASAPPERAKGERALASINVRMPA